MTKSFQYWGVYETGVPATPKGSKKIVEQMAGMLSKPAEGQGRKVCISKVERGGLGEINTGVCYVDGVRHKARVPKI